MTKKSLLFGIAGVLAVLITCPTAQVHGLDNSVLINKSHPLRPRNYTPPFLTVPSISLARQSDDPEMQLASPAAESLTHLFKAAHVDGINLVLASGYRPYEDQAALYNTDVGKDEALAKESVAQPGYSEHQSGLAADVITYDYFCAAQGCFALSKAAAWLDKNAYEYGFVVRYPDYKEASTSYEYEPWHLRYIGSTLALRLHETGQTLEEYYGLP